MDPLKYMWQIKREIEQMVDLTTNKVGEKIYLTDKKVAVALEYNIPICYDASGESLQYTSITNFEQYDEAKYDWRKNDGEVAIISPFLATPNKMYHYLLILQHLKEKLENVDLPLDQAQTEMWQRLGV